MLLHPALGRMAWRSCVSASTSLSAKNQFIKATCLNASVSDVFCVFAKSYHVDSNKKDEDTGETEIKKNWITAEEEELPAAVVHETQIETFGGDISDTKPLELRLTSDDDVATPPPPLATEPTDGEEPRTFLSQQVILNNPSLASVDFHIPKEDPPDADDLPFPVKREHSFVNFNTMNANQPSTGDFDTKFTNDFSQAEDDTKPAPLSKREHSFIDLNANVGQSSIDDEVSFGTELFSTMHSVEHYDLEENSTESSEGYESRLNAHKVFRSMAPYIAIHRDKVMVIHVPGEVLESDNVNDIMHDIVLLKTLGIKPVLVAGCRPQIRKKLIQEGVRSFFVHGNRVCDFETLQHCQRIAGSVRVQIESLLGRGLVNSPTNMATVPVTSGNFVKAIPFGVRHGIDFKYTGTVKKINVMRIKQLLDAGDVVLLGHLGYSASGEIFHCRSEEVAVETAKQLKASKLVFLHNGEAVVDSRKKGYVHNLTLNVALDFQKKLLGELGQQGGKRVSHFDCEPDQISKFQFLDYLQGAITACAGGVNRVHLVSRHNEGGIITELCTRDGTGLMISGDIYEGVRPAAMSDVPSILNLIRPLEEKQILVTRPPQQIESNINRFVVYDRDGEVLACCQLTPFSDKRYGNGAVEMSCVCVTPALGGIGIGNALLSYCLRVSFRGGYTRIFVLTTQSAHWFIDRGFKETPPDALPPRKLASYNHKRKPKVYFRSIDSERAIDETDLLTFNPKTSVF